MKKIVIANWKANLITRQATHWINAVNDYLTNSSLITEGIENISLNKQIQDEVELVVAPSFPQLETVAKLTENSNIALAVQDISQFGCGSYTGEVAIDLVQEFSPKYVLVGHSERRKLLNETNQQVALKMKQAWRAGLTPVLCLDEPDFYSQYQELIDLGVDHTQFSQCVIAYEPLSAIGTGQPLIPDLVSKIVTQLREIYQPRQLIYGGSVSADNLANYLAVCDGALVGKASLDPNLFIELLKVFFV